MKCIWSRYIPNIWYDGCYVAKPISEEGMELVRLKKEGEAGFPPCCSSQRDKLHRWVTEAEATVASPLLACIISSVTCWIHGRPPESQMNSWNYGQNWPGESKERGKEMKFFQRSDVMPEIVWLNKTKETCVQWLYTVRVLGLMPLWWTWLSYLLLMLGLPGSNVIKLKIRLWSSSM